MVTYNLARFKEDPDALMASVTVFSSRRQVRTVGSTVLFSSRFYAIVDFSAPFTPLESARLLLDSGARILQLRLKNVPAREFADAAHSIAELCRRSGATFIVNDRADLAMLSGADGVHLGQEDLPLEAGRRLMGPDRLIGISTHSVAQAREAEANGADYIGFGPIFAGGTKQTQTGQGVDALRRVRAAVRIPIVAIGGITEATAREVIEAGADAAAIISDVLNSPDIRAKVRSLLKTLDGGAAG
jgi:thiamine-phosphate pyrophosphorylase